MNITSKVYEVGILIVSLLLGSAYYYFIDNKKDFIKEMSDVIFQLIIFVVGWKLILNFNFLIQDPISVLVYPSNALSFYLGIISIVVYLWFKNRTLLNRVDLWLRFLLLVSFFYEFMMIIYYKDYTRVYYLVLLGLLLIKGNNWLWFILWQMGIVFLKLYLGSILIFGYSVNIYFHLIFLFGGLLCLKQSLA